MHGNCRFPGSGATLHDHVLLRRFPDDGILLLLDRRYDFPEHCLFILRQIFRQKLIVRHHIRIVKIFQLIVLDLIGSLSVQVDLIGLLIFYRISTAAERILIVNRCHRRTPVDHDFIGDVFRNADPADVAGFVLFQILIVKINSAEIWLFPCPLTAFAVFFCFLVNNLCVVQHGKRFHVFRAIALHQVMEIVR